MSNPLLTHAMKNFWNDPRMSFWNLEQAEALDTPSFTPFPLSSDFEVISSSFGKDVNWFLLAASSSVERSILIDRFFKNILSYFCLHNNVFLIWAEFVFIFVLISIIFQTIMEVPCCVFGSVGPHIPRRLYGWCDCAPIIAQGYLSHRTRMEAALAERHYLLLSTVWV